jgi:hypothetical protein
MAAIDFPDDPEVNDTITIGETTWTWNGSVWQGTTSGGDAANDFVVAIPSLSSSISFGVEYPAGTYSFESSGNDASLDIYLLNSAGDLVGYTGVATITASGPFTKMVILGGTQGDKLSFEYISVFVATADSDEFKAGPFVLSVNPTLVPEVDDTFEITGGNFATDCEVFVRGQNNVETEAKSVVRTSGTSLLVTRPDTMPEAQSPYDVIVRNPNIPSPSNSTVNILQNSITPGSKPVWYSPATLSPFTKNVEYSYQLIAADPEDDSLTYSIVSGSLPTGLSLDSATGLISGVPTSSTSATLTIRATDEFGLFLDRAFTLPNSGPLWVTTTVPVAQLNAAYSITLIANDDSGVTPTFSISSGTLPVGLSLNPATGVISGTATVATAGNTVVFTATDANGRAASQTIIVRALALTRTVITSSGTFNYPSTAVEILGVLAVGGGASGGDGNAPGGGGGAGELIEGIPALVPGSAYTVTIGAGGAQTNQDVAGNPGANTSLALGATTIIRANGGGRGAGFQSGNTAGSGGSGGGGAGPSNNNSGAAAGAIGIVPAGMTSYRNAGGNFSGTRGGGGGGATAAGTNGGNGGAGFTSSLSGSSVTYAKGGDGGAGGSDSPTGSNGNGGRGGNDNAGQAGQPGVFIIAYYAA